jgi:hypothetical protein
MIRILDWLGPPRSQQEFMDDRCVHGALSPAWDDPHDIGQVLRASRFICESCGERFAPDEVIDVRRNATRRLRSAAERS